MAAQISSSYRKRTPMEKDRIEYVFNNNQDSAVMDSGHQIKFNREIQAVMLDIDGPDGKGKILIERGANGAYIWVNGKCLAMVDLFYYSDECKSGARQGDPLDFPQLIFYTEGDEALGRIRWLEGATQLLVDRLEARHYKDYFGHTITIDEGTAPPT
jgi:hypothetical protein